MAWLARIAVHPVKSLDPHVVESVRVLPSGALQNDRRFALCDDKGAFITGKRTPLVHRLRLRYLADARVLTLAVDGNAPRDFHVDSERQLLEDWLSDYFSTAIHVKENAARGFPDDTDFPGPTVISTATLETVCSWFPGLTLDEARLRFRANLEIGEVEPFWEDRLCGPAGTAVRFSIGGSLFDGMNPCARCVVPTRVPTTGVGDAEFMRTFIARRGDSFPSWAETSRFDHFYRLAMNTSPVPGKCEGLLSVGDRVQIETED